MKKMSESYLTCFIGVKMHLLKHHSNIRIKLSRIMLVVVRTFIRPYTTTTLPEHTKRLKLVRLSRFSKQSIIPVNLLKTATLGVI